MMFLSAIIVSLSSWLSLALAASINEVSLKLPYIPGVPGAVSFPLEIKSEEPEVNYE
jgi:hypothetical protein